MFVVGWVAGMVLVDVKVVVLFMVDLVGLCLVCVMMGWFLVGLCVLLWVLLVVCGLVLFGCLVVSMVVGLCAGV